MICSMGDSVIRIEVLSRERVPQLVPLKHDGFGSKRCCLCFAPPLACERCATGEGSECSSFDPCLTKQTLRGYAAYPDSKIALCGTAVEYAPGEEHQADKGKVVGFCQARRDLSSGHPPPPGRCRAPRLFARPSDPAAAAYAPPSSLALRTHPRTTN